MRTLILILTTIVISGCASTPHDYCTSHSEHYSSYNECYVERVQRQQQLAHAFDGMGRSNQSSCYNYGNSIQCH